jgi:signal transduction histidine kinase/DNA-binding NarL/FixJ family response regulator
VNSASSRPFRPLAGRLATAVVVVCVSCALLAMVLQGGQAWIAAERAQRRTVEEITRSRLPGLTAALWDVDTSRVQQEADEIARQPEVAGVRLHTTGGQRFVAGDPDAAAGAAVELEVPHPVAGGTPLGKLAIAFDHRPAREALVRALLQTAVGIALLAALIAMLVIRFLRRELSRPLQLIADYARGLTPDAAAPPLQLPRRQRPWKDDLDLVVDAFHTMHDGLRRYADERNEALRALAVERDQLDITVHQRTADLLRANESLAQARQTAEAASRAKSEFLSTMSHELRTPLNAVLGYAQLLMREKGMGERHVADLRIIQRSGEHLLTLINDLLDLAKIEAGKFEVVPGPASLPMFLRAVADIVRVKAEEKDLLFVLDASPDLPRAVEVDEKRLRQVLLNLLSNAVKFTRRGEVRLVVRRLSPDAAGPLAKVGFEVHDTGVGMRREQLDGLFTPFAQMGDAQSRSAGTGLGLAISRELVRLMGGDIAVVSEAGQGSRFSFELSLPVLEAEPEDAVPRMQTITGYAGPRRRLMVVDDLAANRDLLVRLLQPLGFELAEAGGGEEALARAAEFRPDLILMDMLMPDMDGLEATRRLLAVPDFAALRIVIVSANATAQDRAASSAAGACGFVPKPIAHDQLLAEVGQHLGLQWIEEQTSARSPETNTGPLIAPPAHELTELYEAALSGRMRDVRQHAARLAEAGDHYRAFAEKLQLMASAFQSKAIVDLLEKHMQETVQ